MRILRVIRSVNPAGGGPIEGIRQVSRLMEAAGHSVEIACLDGPEVPWVRNFPGKIHALGNGREGYGYSPAFVRWLRAHRTDFDMVVVSGLWLYSSAGTWLALRGTDTPYCLFPHGMLDPWFKRHYPLKHLKKLLYWWLVEYRVLRDARCVFFTSEEERLLARTTFKPYRCRERVVRYGTAGPVGEPGALRAAFFEQFPELAGKRLVLFLGRLHEKKGCELAIEAFLAAARACASDPRPPVLLMAGPCAEPHYLEQLQVLAASSNAGQAHSGEEAPRVVFPGMLSGALKWGAYFSADVFVLPSHQENFGISVAEALACSCPVLISNRVNIWREIQAANAGLIEEDSQAGTERLLRRWFESSSAERVAMRGNALRCFQERFHIQMACEDLLKTLAAILEEGGAL